MDPIEPDGLAYITENEVLRLADGELTAKVDAVFQAPDREYVSLHTIIAGTGRYAGATGNIQLRGDGSEIVVEYVAVIRLAK